MSNSSPETQNVSRYFPSSSDTDPQEGGPWLGCVSLCVSLMLAQLSHGAVWMSAVSCPHTFARVQRARLIYDSLTLWSSSVYSSNCLFSSPLLTLCHNCLRLPALLCQRALSASGRSLHQTFMREVKVTHVTLLGNCKTNIWHTKCKKQSH